MVLVLLTAVAARAQENAVTFPPFGRVTLYSTAPQPQAVVLFVSGDGGWNQGVVDMARELAAQGALVAGLDIRTYLSSLAAGKEACAYPAADFEALGKFIQKRQGLSRYLPPILVGYSSGATLVYAVLAQAPGSTFSGAISLGFCPDLLVGKPLCKGAGLTFRQHPKLGYIFNPAPHLTKPWIVLQGDIDQVCDTPKTKIFVDQVPQGRIILLPKVGHGFSVPRNWLPQLKEAFGSLISQSSQAGRTAPGSAKLDLPLVEIPSPGGSSPSLAVFYSGDGGWADLDEQVSLSLARQGLPVVGLNSLAYFWKKRDPESAAADLKRVIDHYLALWKRERVVLIGYSFGAEVLPFLAARLPEETARRLELIALLGPGPQTDFEFHLSDWLGQPSRTSRPVKPEIDKLPEVPILCLYGDKENDSLCPGLAGGKTKALVFKGAHHLGGDYQGLARAILANLGR